MHRIENFLVLSAVLACYRIFVPYNATAQPVTFKIEAINPIIRKNHQMLVLSVVEMIPKELFQSVFREFVLTEFTELVVAAFSECQLCLWLFVSGVLDVMDAPAVQQGVDLINGQLEVMDVSSHIVSEVLVEQRQLEVQMFGVAGDFDVAADVSVKDSASIFTIHQRGQILLL